MQRPVCRAAWTGAEGGDVAEDRKERFRRIYEEHSGSVYTYALRRTHSPEEAKDVVSETFLTAWRRLESVPERPLAWLLGTARGTVANHLRAATNREHLVRRMVVEAEPRPAGPLPAESEPLPDDAAARTRAALDLLADADREALRLLYWDGLSGAEAARALGCTRAAIQVRAHRARQRLKQILLAERNGYVAMAETESAGGSSR
jgi:RNA polymerase sigma factor (sigma-70 family)